MAVAVGSIGGRSTHRASVPPMADLPTGTVTFLFTDIAGSTRLWERHPDAMRGALARHDALVRSAIEAHGGHVFKTVGDAFCAAFQTAPAAVAAALAAQRALAAEAWPAEAPIAVRVGIHTGAAEARDGDYVGTALNRVARLMGAGHGGQVLVSAAAWELVRDDLPDGVGLRDLGERRLKDLRRPERVFQLSGPGLAAEFPPLATLDARPHNLPVQVTSFVGRERETADLKRLLATARLVTLTGIGGTGKTRLALQAAADRVDDFADGVWFVDLAPLTDGVLVAPTTAAVLGVRDKPGRPIEATLVERLAGKSLLVVLDNCEHVVEASAALADRILRGAPAVRILATSREALAVAGEATLALAPLATPDPAAVAAGRADAAAALGQYEAVRLFVDRAVAVKADFAVTNANAPAVAGICHRLDGIPLAIELAAARVRMMTADEIHRRLGDRFRLLTGGARTVASRQQTLAAAIDWSHDLLEPAEQALFRRLAVFRGGWTMAAAEAVGAAGDVGEAGAGGPSWGDDVVAPWAVLDLLGRLVDKSLVVADEDGDETRYRYFETVLAYARDRLAAAGEVERARDRHLAWCLDFAQAAEPHLSAPDAPNWIGRLEREADNVRGALEWGLGAEDGARSERGVRLVLVIATWFPNWSDPQEWIRWTGAAATRAVGLDASLLALCWLWNGESYRRANDPQHARPILEQAAAMLESLGRERELSWALQNLGSLMCHNAAEYDAGRRLLERSVALKRRSAPAWDLAIVITNLGEAARTQGHFGAAISAYEEAVSLTESEIGLGEAKVWPLHNLGLVLLRTGAVARSRDLLTQALGVAHAYRLRDGVASSVAGLAGVAAADGDGVRAARLFGASDALRTTWSLSPWEPVDRRDHDHNQAIARALLAEDTWAAAHAEGLSLDPEQAVAYALGDLDPWSTRDG